jgi:DNA primase catalytic core
MITDFLKYELYPALFEVIDIALPEFNFMQVGGDWRSGVKLDLSAPKQKRPDKTVVTKKAPSMILEQGGEALSLVDYVMRRDSIEFITAVKHLADKVGLKLPETELNKEEFTAYSKINNILEDCNSYFIYCLENSTEAEDVKSYLSSRGYSLEDVKTMELGYIPDQSKLFTYLTETKGHDKETVKGILSLNTAIGSTHKLTIPYRSGGSIKGFKFRTIGEATPKYLNSTGLEKSGGFFNISGIKGDKDVVIVEGELDSLSATARGLENIVATGGSSISSEQIKDAIKRGAKSFTLCFDFEPDKEEATAKNINRAIEVILAEGVNRVYIVTLPDLGGKTDPDRLIKESGVGALKEAIRGALPYYEYKLQETLKKYGEIEEKRGLEPRDIDSLLEEIVETSSKLEPIDKDRYKKLFTSLEAIQALGISKESLDITVDKLTATRDKEAQAVEFKKLLSRATELQDKGEVAEALELLNTKVKEVKLQNKATEFSRLLIPTTEAQIKAEEANLPDSLNTGLTIDKEDLLLPSGAISVFAAPTNHGKTALLINTALNVAERYPDKQFIFFTYEERDTSILQYFLNTYIDLGLNNSGYQNSNRKIIRDYFKTGSTQFIAQENVEYFESQKEEFFRTYIETGRILIKYVDYNSVELTTAIQYLNKEAKNIGGVFIDYFQLLKLPKEKGSRQEELKQICMDLKDAAVATGLPVVLAAQFNREVTNLQRLHPTKIGEAGDIERIVNTLIGLWNMDKKPVLNSITDAEQNEIDIKLKNRPSKSRSQSKMYLEILKSRDLPTGAFDFLDFNGRTGKVKNREPHNEIKNEDVF